MVNRLSKKALRQILAGKVKEPASVVVKFYGNDCHYCHSLKSVYESLIDEYEDVLFFAFNIDDYPEAQKILNFRGVPTICMMKVGSSKPKLRVMPEPEKPNKDTWYDMKDIKSFIEKER